MRSRWLIFLPVAFLALLPSHASALNLYTYATNFSCADEAHQGSVVQQSEYEFTITGANAGGCQGGAHVSEVMASLDPSVISVSFDWNYSTVDGWIYDVPEYFANGSWHSLQNGWANNQAGSMTIDLTASELGFRIRSIDSIAGVGILVIANGSLILDAPIDSTTTTTQQAPLDTGSGSSSSSSPSTIPGIQSTSTTSNTDPTTTTTEPPPSSTSISTTTSSTTTSSTTTTSIAPPLPAPPTTLHDAIPEPSTTTTTEPIPDSIPDSIPATSDVPRIDPITETTEFIIEPSTTEPIVEPTIDTSIPTSDLGIEEPMILDDSEIVVAALFANVAPSEITVEQLSSVLDSPAFEELSDQELEAFAELLSEAPSEVKAEFEEKIDVFNGSFDNYIPNGSVISVSQRRVLVVVAGLLLTASSPIPGARRNEMD